MLSTVLSNNLFNLAILLVLLCSLLFFLVVLTKFLSLRYTRSVEKVSPYECGFAPLSTAREKHKVPFLVVGILFLIFDLELAILLPWTLFFFSFPPYVFFTVMLFIFLLIIGFLLEVFVGLLDI